MGIPDTAVNPQAFTSTWISFLVPIDGQQNTEISKFVCKKYVSPYTFIRMHFSSFSPRGFPVG